MIIPHVQLPVIAVTLSHDLYLNCAVQDHVHHVCPTSAIAFCLTVQSTQTEPANHLLPPANRSGKSLISMKSQRPSSVSMAPPMASVQLMADVWFAISCLLSVKDILNLQAVGAAEYVCISSCQVD
jgi:hypothetical protein